MRFFVGPGHIRTTPSNDTYHMIAINYAVVKPHGA
jgi:hypothetical protein